MIFRLISASTETTNIIRYKEARGEVAISGRPKHVTFVATWVEGDADAHGYWADKRRAACRRSTAPAGRHDCCVG